MNKNQIPEFVGDIMTWLCLLIFAFGLVGNTSSFLVYSHSRTLKKLSISLYYRVASLADLVVTIFLLFLFLNDKFQLTNSSHWFCKIFSFATYVPETISGCIQLIISTDRLINIVYPRKFPLLTHKLKFQTPLLTCIAAANFFFYSYVPIQSHL
jgi:hypothetical protein